MEDSDSQVKRCCETRPVSQRSRNYLHATLSEYPAVPLKLAKTLLSDGLVVRAEGQSLEGEYLLILALRVGWGVPCLAPLAENLLSHGGSVQPLSEVPHQRSCAAFAVRFAERPEPKRSHSFAFLRIFLRSAGRAAH